MGRFKRVRVLLALAVVATGLVVVNSGASALPTNNYTGPRDCADVEAEYDLDFECLPAAANATQSSDGGVNLYEATGNGGTVTQMNTSGPNIAKCVLDSGTVGGATASTTQSCNFTQDTDPGTGDNTIIAELKVTHSISTSLQTLTSTISQTVVGSQSSASGTNTVRGPAAGSAALLQTSQSQTVSIDASVPPSQAQERRLLLDVDQNASTSGNNWASFNLNSAQTINSDSILAGSQNQDVVDTNGAATDDPNARGWVYQRTATGQNYTKGRGTDAKVANAQSTFTGVTQNQWHTGGGFDISADVDGGTNGTVDFGTPFGEGTYGDDVDGFRKIGTITTEQGAPGLAGTPTTAGSRSQNDKLPITIPGTSPENSTVAGSSELTAPDGTLQTADISVDGHADNAIVGAISANLVSGGTTSGHVPFNDQTVHVNLECKRHAPNTCGTSGGGITGSGTDVSAVEDVQFTAEVASYENDNPNAPATSAEINWGDGSDPDVVTPTENGGNGTVTGTHTYANPDTYTIDTTLYVGETVAATMSSTATVADVDESAWLNAGSFVISDAKAVQDATVTFWGDSWSAQNQFASGKFAPSAFKGFENTINQPNCSAAAQTWKTTTGNSPPPPAGTLPQYMRVIVATKATSVKSVPQGDIYRIGIVETSGTTYGPSPSQTGKGTFIGFYC